MVFGTDKIEDMKNMQAFESGNPYKFAAAMKYIFGTHSRANMNAISA
jgi:hypothetical protein